MASKVNVCNVVVMDNPSSFFNPFQFEITFECFENLEEDLEWKLTYVGSAESDKYDQMLDSVLVGPIPEGRHMFVFQAQAPESEKIPASEAMGVTVILLSCAYRNQEFIKIGYFVQNEYEDEEMKENPPEIPQFDKLKRRIVADEPRVTRFQIKWSDQTESSTGDAENSVDGMNDEENKPVMAPPDDDSMSSPPKKSQDAASYANSAKTGALEEMREKAKALNDAGATQTLNGAVAVNGHDDDVNMK